MMRAARREPKPDTRDTQSESMPCERAPTPQDLSVGEIRMDAHVHSRASSGSATAALGLLGVPECYSEPEEVYERARSAGMDLVTLTDHDTIAGALELIERGFEGVVVGEEVTVCFPEDRCRLHVLVWGITPEQHEQITRQNLRADVYDFARWLREQNLAHSLAHPLYDQNARLDLWHIERCALLFKNFETINGGHERRHTPALDAFLRSLTPGRMLRLAHRHDIEPLWARAWEKGTTGGSDDHGLLHVACAWTSVRRVPGLDDAEAFLRALRHGACEARGVGGDAARLAHQFTSVGARFISTSIPPPRSPEGHALRARLMRFAGVREREPRRLTLALARLRTRLTRRRAPSVPALEALRAALSEALKANPAIAHALESGEVPLARHDAMQRFVLDLTAALVCAVEGSVRRRSGRADAREMLTAATVIGASHMAQIPYIYAMFQQNRERWLARRLRETSRGEAPARPLRVLLFTDTLGDVNGVTRFIRDNARDALARGRSLTVLTSTRMPVPDLPNVRNFRPLLSMKMPGYDHLEVVLPPLLEMLREADRLQPDVIHISTPGPVGVLGMIASAMTRTPVVATYHTDFPAYVDDIFDDHVMTRTARQAMRAFYGRCRRVLTRSACYVQPLQSLGIRPDRIATLPAGCDVEAFHPRHRDLSVWDALDPHPGVRVLSCGRLSVEKNLPMLTDIWTRASRRLQALGIAARLVVVGDGPYHKTMQRRLARTPATFLGYRHGEELARIYASSDLFIFPSLTDTLGQAVMEAQASGLPALVSDQGGPSEIVEDGRTGRVLPADDVDAWVDAVVELVRQRRLREEMGRRAHEAMRRRGSRAMFDAFWREHERVFRDFLMDKDMLAEPPRDRQVQVVSGA